MEAHLVLDAHATLGEGPLWSVREQALYWLDILAFRVHRFDPASRENRTCQLDEMVGVVVERARGGLAVGLKSGFAGLDFSNGGRFWAGSESKDKTGGFHRLDADHRSTQVLSGIGCSNGLAWTADGRTLYYIDTGTAQIAAFPFDPERGTLGERRVVVAVDVKEHGWPDGMCIDAEGTLWCGHWGGWRLNRWDPRSGELIATIKLPVSQVTSCAFAGPKLDHLLITSAAAGLNDEARALQPHAGGLFRVDTGPIGLPSVAFAG
jgi:sugar lactone lactonase YvrE